MLLPYLGNQNCSNGMHLTFCGYVCVFMEFSQENNIWLFLSRSSLPNEVKQMINYYIFYDRVKTKQRAHYGYPIYTYMAGLEKVHWRPKVLTHVLFFSSSRSSGKRTWPMFLKASHGLVISYSQCTVDRSGALLGQSSYKTVHCAPDLFYPIMVIWVWHVKMTKSQGDRTGIYPREGATLESYQTCSELCISKK